MKGKQTIEYRYYNIPVNEYVLPLLGEDWRGVYGEENSLHFHNLMEIGACHEGKGHLIFEDFKVPYSGNHISIIPANYPHSTLSYNRSENFWEYIFLDPEAILKSVYPDDEDFVTRMLGLINKNVRFLKQDGSNSELYTLIGLLFEECRNRKNYSNEVILFMVASILIMISRLDQTIKEENEVRADKSRMDRLSGALEYINANYMNEITIDDLARECFISKTHFRRLFDECMNMSPLEYLNYIRVRKSCDLLLKTKFSMENVAFKCGFSNFSTFNRNFKKVMGITPYQYRINKDNMNGKLLDYKITAKKGWLDLKNEHK